MSGDLHVGMHFGAARPRLQHPAVLVSLSQDGNGCRDPPAALGEQAQPAALAVRGHKPRRCIHYHSLRSGVGREAGMQGCGGRVDGVSRSAGEQLLALR